jgi:hypothetical protein
MKLPPLVTKIAEDEPPAAIWSPWLLLKEFSKEIAALLGGSLPGDS